jgi:hypothetical protein
MLNAVLPKETALDIGIDGDCPICAQNRDSETGLPRYNATTLAAMQEAKDIMSGKIETKWYKPHEFEQAKRELLED